MGAQTLPELQQEVHHHRSQLQDLQTDLEAQQSLLDNKKYQAKQLKVKLATGGDLTVLHTKVEDLHALITDTQVKTSSLQSKIHSEQTLLHELQERQTQYQQEQQSLASTEDLEKYRQQQDSKLREYIDQQQLVEQQSQQHQQTQLLSLQQLQNANAILSQQLSADLKERQSLEQQLQQAQEHLTELKHLTDNSSSMIQQLQNEVSQKMKLIEQKDIEIASLRQQIEEYERQIADVEIRFKEEQKRRKEFQFKYEDAKGKVRVYARCRPFSKKEIAEKEDTLLRAGRNEWSLELNETERDVMGNIKEKWRDYVFDHVFQFGLPAADGFSSKGNASQLQVFEECKDFCELTMNGINTCIFAYGQSGTGKTFTMAGIKPPPENPTDNSLIGLKPRMIDYVWKLVKDNSSTHTYTVSAYLVEIYLNKLEDVFFKHEQNMKKRNNPNLKSPKKAAEEEAPELRVRVDAKKRVEIENVLIKPFTDYETMNAYCDEAEMLRRTRKTGLNEASSRSHLVLTILITATETKTGKTVRGKLSLVDLAGSERADKTNVEGLTKKERESMMEEGIAINESLRMLKNVFRILGSMSAPQKPGELQSPGKAGKPKEEVVQYRGNMLTELMQDSLGGNAKTLMFVNVGPAASNISETQDSLGYGDFVKNITNEKATSDVDFTEQIRVLKQKIAVYELRFGTEVVG